MPDRYARAVAYYRQPDLPKALGLVDGLIAEYPQDPYFYELKGQMLFENGRVMESIEPNRAGAALPPGLGPAPLRARPLAAWKAATTRIWKKSAALLRDVVRVEPDNPGAWRFLGIAEGRLGREGPSAMALAEQAVIIRNRKDAELYLRRAEQFIEPDDPNWYPPAGPLARGRGDRGAAAPTALRGL